MRSRRGTSRWRQPLDQWAITAVLVLTVVTALVMISGDHASARVRSFSWDQRDVGAEDQAFLLTFSRPMDPASVEENLVITPDLPGKFSWAGRRMAYTLDTPAPYGETFTVKLDQAQDQYSARQEQSGEFQPFQSQFQTRPRAFAYIATVGENRGRLMLVDLRRGRETPLTPEGLAVLAFEPYPLGDRILFSATEATPARQGGLSPRLYTVTTGYTTHPPVALGEASETRWWGRRQDAKSTPAGDVTLVLDRQGYQNLKFDLSPNGEFIIVQRVNQENPSDFGPWIIQEGKPPRPLDTEPGGDFLIAPDNQSLVMLQGEGTAIIPLETRGKAASSHEPLDFLPEYGRVFDLKRDGSAAAMVNFNQDDPERRYVESLFLVTNQGAEKELLQASGAVLDAQFAPSQPLLYVLTSEVLPGEAYVEQPLLTAIDLKAETLTDLLVLPPQKNVHMSVAPDGLALLLDLTQVNADPATADLEGSIWLLPLFKSIDDRRQGKPSQTQPEPLPFRGVQATWLP